MTTPPPAGWYADPTGRYEQRYSNGDQWTEHVANGTEMAVDHYVEPPLPEPPLPEPPASDGPVFPTPPGAEVTQPGFQYPLETTPTPVAETPDQTRSFPPDQPPPTHPGPTMGAAPPTAGPDGGTDGTRWGMVALIVGLLVAVVVGGIVLVVVLAQDDNGDDPSDTTEVGGDLPAASDPESDIAEFGSDAELDGLARDCESGSMSACDQLYFNAPVNSDYEMYGDTCGGRTDPGQFCETLY